MPITIALVTSLSERKVILMRGYIHMTKLIILVFSLEFYILHSY